MTDITAKRSFGLVLLIPRAVVLLPHKVPRRRRPVALNEAKTVPNLHKRAWRRLDVGIEEPPTEAETVDPVVRLPPRWRKYPSAADGTLATTTARMRCWRTSIAGVYVMVRALDDIEQGLPARFHERSSTGSLAMFADADR